MFMASKKGDNTRSLKRPTYLKALLLLTVVDDGSWVSYRS